MSEEEAVVLMEHTISFYAQRLHQRFQGYLVPWSMEDLQQEGRLAVVLVSRTFDPTRAAFQTYAKPRIWGTMVDYVRRLLPRKRRAAVTAAGATTHRGGHVMPPRHPAPAPSLGQRVYTAYWHAWPARALPWHLLSVQERRAWEAAAQAITAVDQGPVVPEEDAPDA